MPRRRSIGTPNYHYLALCVAQCVSLIEAGKRGRGRQLICFASVVPECISDDLPPLAQLGDGLLQLVALSLLLLLPGPSQQDDEMFGMEWNGMLWI